MPNPDFPRSATKSILGWLDLSAYKAEADEDRLEAAVKAASIALNTEEVRLATVSRLLELHRGDDSSHTLTLCVFTDERMAVVYLEDFGDDDSTSPEHVSVSSLRFAHLGVNPTWDNALTEQRMEAVTFVVMKPSTTEAYASEFAMPPRRRPADEQTMEEEDAETVRRIWTVLDFLRSKVVAE